LEKIIHFNLKINCSLFQKEKKIMSERVIVISCQLSNFTAISWQEQVNFQ
jgi:hypothetical protein